MIAQDDWYTEISLELTQNRPLVAQEKSMLSLLFPECFDPIGTENAMIRKQMSVEYVESMVRQIQPIQNLVNIAKIQARETAKNRKRRKIMQELATRWRVEKSSYIPSGYSTTTSL